MKLNYRKTFILGLGFFAISLAWSVYNSYVPIFLRDIFADWRFSSLIVGALLTLDNIAAITLQPFFGALSDKTWNKYGRRMPYIIFATPVAAAAFILIPMVRTLLVPLLLVVFVMNVAMAVFRAPTVALMPDMTPSELRSKANGVINLMGGLGALLAYFGFSQLYRQSAALPFLATSVLMVGAAYALYRFIKEQPGQQEAAAEEKGTGILQSMREIMLDSEGSERNLFFAIFLWFAGFSGVEAFFTIYGTEVWQMDPGQAAFYLGFMSLSFLAFAIPAGFIATRYGRRRTIQVGVIGMAISMGSFLFIEPLPLIATMLIVAGFFWAAININSYPMVTDMAGEQRLGTYTGLYYFFSSLAAILSPPFFGVLMDLLGRRTLFAVAVLCFLGAWNFVRKVRRGEGAQATPIG